MKRISIFLPLSLIMVFFISCRDDLENLNINSKAPIEVAGENLFIHAEKKLADQIKSADREMNPTRLWTQYWQEALYLDESRYDMVTRSIPSHHWSVLYEDVLKNLDEAALLIDKKEDSQEDTSKPNKLAIIEILKTYAFSNLVETYGDIPYTEALDGENPSPGFDDGETVYKDLIERLKLAVEALDISEGSFEEEDLIYHGNVEKWRKFGNSLLLRMGMVMADVDSDTSIEAVNAAVNSNGGVFTDIADDARYAYSASAPNYNTTHQFVIANGRDDFVIGSTIVNLMDKLDDPRRAAYFDDNVTPYKGGSMGETSDFATHTHINPAVTLPDRPGTILSYIETEFLLAEAAARGGYNVSGDPKSHYNKGIEASFEKWDIDNVQNYLQNPEVDYDSALSNSSSNPKWKEVIGNQLWLGLFNDTFAPYLHIRRLDYPVLEEVNRRRSDFPVRYIYPIEEQNLNTANYDEAVNNIGGDTPETRLFWDKEDSNWGW